MSEDAETAERAEFLASLPPLVRASAVGDIVEVRMLLESGEAPSELHDGWTALHAAAVNGHVQVVSLLLDAGAVVDACDESGITALWNAAGPSPSPQVIRLLLAAGAHPNATDTTFGWTPLSRAVEYGNHDSVDLLIAAGASVTMDDKGWTLLMDAAETGDAVTARTLIAAGVDVSAVGDEGTALDIARRRGHTEVAEVVAEAMRRGTRAAEA